jgi:xanthine dehydrogenase small subunit
MDDISTVAAAIAVFSDSRVRMGLGGVAATPVVFEAPDTKAVQEILRATLKPMSDHRGSAAYRLALAQNLLARFES